MNRMATYQSNRFLRLIEESLNARYGSLVVTDIVRRGKVTYAICQCDCGAISMPHLNSIKQGHTKSCGCKRDGYWAMKHGGCRGKGRRLPEYGVWSHMRQRCTNPNDSRFHVYGARGISVCERWHSFANFLEDMGRRPSSKHSIDRIDNNGNYEPSNCRWATTAEQSCNRSDNRILTFNGESLLLKQWSDRLKIKELTIFMRLKRGWTVEQALTLPLCNSRGRPL